MVFFVILFFLPRALCFSRLLQMEVPERKLFSSNVITTQSRLSDWIFQRGPGFKLSSFKDSTRSVTGAFKAARQPSRHLEPTRAHCLRALAYCSPLYSPAGRNVARTAGYEIQQYVFADCRPQYVFPFALAVFFCCVILICVAQWCRCRSAWMRSRLPFRISLTGTLLRVRRRVCQHRLVSQSRRLYRSALEVGCSDVIACPTRSTLSPVL